MEVSRGVMVAVLVWTRREAKDAVAPSGITDEMRCHQGEGVQLNQREAR